MPIVGFVFMRSDRLEIFGVKVEVYANFQMGFPPDFAAFAIDKRGKGVKNRW